MAAFCDALQPSTLNKPSYIMHPTFTPKPTLLYTVNLRPYKDQMEVLRITTRKPHDVLIYISRVPKGAYRGDYIGDTYTGTIKRGTRNPHMCSCGEHARIANTHMLLSIVAGYCPSPRNPRSRKKMFTIFPCCHCLWVCSKPPII